MKQLNWNNIKFYCLLKQRETQIYREKKQPLLKNKENEILKFLVFIRKLCNTSKGSHFNRVKCFILTSTKTCIKKYIT